MPSIGHIAVGMAAGRRAGVAGVPYWRWLVWYVGVSCAADLDFILVALGVPKDSLWGHRGVSHSLLAAVLAGFATAYVARRWAEPARWAFVGGFAVYASHGLFDCLNVGSIGVPLLWPLSSEYVRLPFHPIPAVETASDFLTPKGIPVLAAEVVLFAPFWLYALLAGRLFRVGSKRRPGGPAWQTGEADRAAEETT